MLLSLKNNSTKAAIKNKKGSWHPTLSGRLFRVMGEAF